MGVSDKQRKERLKNASRIRELAEGGLTTREISEVMKMSYTRIRETGKLHGIEIKKTPSLVWTDEETHILAKAVENNPGISAVDVSKKFLPHRTPHAVMHRALRLGADVTRCGLHEIGVQRSDESTAPYHVMLKVHNGYGKRNADVKPVPPSRAFLAMVNMRLSQGLEIKACTEAVISY